MGVDTSERDFEATVEDVLINGRPATVTEGVVGEGETGYAVPGGYQKRRATTKLFASTPARSSTSSTPHRCRCGTG